jgi:hypothetical protein
MSQTKFLHELSFFLFIVAMVTTFWSSTHSCPLALKMLQWSEFWHISVTSWTLFGDCARYVPWAVQWCF